MLTPIKRLIQDVKAIIATLNSGATLLQAALAINAPTTPVGLAIGGTKTNVYTGALGYVIAGKSYTKGAVAAGTAPGTDVVPQNKYGAVAFDIDAAGTITAAVAPANATGYASAAAAAAALPACAAAKARLGYVTAKSSGAGGFTFGTDNFDAAGTTVAYTDATTWLNQVLASANTYTALVQKSY